VLFDRYGGCLGVFFGDTARCGSRAAQLPTTRCRRAAAGAILVAVPMRSCPGPGPAGGGASSAGETGQQVFSVPVMALSLLERIYK
jgi:hypothetical protein